MTSVIPPLVEFHRLYIGVNKVAKHASVGCSRSSSDPSIAQDRDMTRDVTRLQKIIDQVIKSGGPSQQRKTKLQNACMSNAYKQPQYFTVPSVRLGSAALVTVGQEQCYKVNVELA